MVLLFFWYLRYLEDREANLNPYRRDGFVEIEICPSATYAPPVPFILPISLCVVFMIMVVRDNKCSFVYLLFKSYKWLTAFSCHNVVYPSNSASNRVEWIFRKVNYYLVLRTEDKKSSILTYIDLAITHGSHRAHFCFFGSQPQAIGPSGRFEPT